MKFKLKQLVYVKQYYRRFDKEDQEYYVLARVTQVSRDPNFIYCQTVAGAYNLDEKDFIAVPDYLHTDKKMTKLVPIELIFDKEGIEALYG